jgi:hypothetical protein
MASDTSALELLSVESMSPLVPRPEDGQEDRVVAQLEEYFQAGEIPIAAQLQSRTRMPFEQRVYRKLIHKTIHHSKYAKLD